MCIFLMVQLCFVKAKKISWNVVVVSFTAIAEGVKEILKTHNIPPTRAFKLAVDGFVCWLVA